MIVALAAGTQAQIVSSTRSRQGQTMTGFIAQTALG